MSRPITVEEMVELFKSRHKTTHLLKIDNFSLLTKHLIERVESSVFILGGHKWKLYVYPNGNNMSAIGHVSIFLENQDRINVKIEYQIFAVSQLKAEWHPSNVKLNFGTTSTPKRRGIPKLISLIDLKSEGYIIEDCCMFGVQLHGFEPVRGEAESFSLIEKPINHKVTWMMTHFSSFDSEKCHHSHEFVVGNRKWRIKVYPRGFKGGKDKSFSVYLLGEDFIKNAPKAKTFTKFKLQVLDQICRKNVERTDSCWFDAEDDDKNGFDNFMPLKKLDKPYLVNDKLYVGVDFDVISITNSI